MRKTTSHWLALLPLTLGLSLPTLLPVTLGVVLWSSPALACSRVDSAVSFFCWASRPARSGCARISASCWSRGAARIVAQSAACSCSALAKGRCGQVSSATHGECSNKCPSAATKAGWFI